MRDSLMLKHQKKNQKKANMIVVTFSHEYPSQEKGPTDFGVKGRVIKTLVLNKTQLFVSDRNRT